MKLFDTIKKQMMGKVLLTDGKQPFIVEAIIIYYKNLSDDLDDYWKVKTKEIDFNYNLNTVKIFGSYLDGDKFGEQTSVNLRINKLLDAKVVSVEDFKNKNY